MGIDQIRQDKVDIEKEEEDEEEEEKMNKFYAIIRQFTQVRGQIQQSSNHHSNSNTHSPDDVLKFGEEKLLRLGGETNEKALPSWGPCFKWEDFRDCDFKNDSNNNKEKPADYVGGNNKKRKVMKMINNVADDYETSEIQCRSSITTTTTGLDLNLAL